MESTGTAGRTSLLDLPAACTSERQDLDCLSPGVLGAASLASGDLRAVRGSCVRLRAVCDALLFHVAALPGRTAAVLVRHASLLRWVSTPRGRGRGPHGGEGEVGQTWRQVYPAVRRGNGLDALFCGQVQCVGSARQCVGVCVHASSLLNQSTPRMKIPARPSQI